MLLRRITVGMFSVSLMALGAGMLYGQAYPNKPIRIVTGTAGGGSDFTARLIAQGISGPLGQTIIVENRGSGLVSAEIVLKALPDGYTLLLAGNTFMLGHLLQKTPYNSVTDFSPITAVANSSSILVVHPSLPAKSVKELIALARARPGVLNYASGLIGSSNHLGAELFKAMTGVNIIRINYKGTGSAVAALLGGEEVQLMFSSIASVMPHVKSGRLIALAVTSAQPSALAPGLPTVAASGLPGYEVLSADSLFAPAKTPAAIINLLHQEIVRLLSRPDVKQKFFDAGVETIGNSPQELVALMKSQIATMGKVIKDAGIRVE